MNLDIVPALAIGFILAFARIGTLVMLLPGLGEPMIPARLRLAIALALTFVLFPLVRADYPTLPGAPEQIVLLLVEEIAIGAVLGITGRIVMGVLSSAGTIIAEVLGLSFLTSTDPTQGQQGALVGSFLSVLGIAVIFATDLDHLAIAALGQSYDIFRPGLMPPVGDASIYVIRLVASSFALALQIAAPVVVFAVVFNVGLGVLARLMPQMQVFFVGVPGAILIGFAIFALTLSAMMMAFGMAVRHDLGALSGLGG
ncbi:MAG TPA: flagellar biosynthetic protein FliR [Hyphomicrobiales bacterium]|nr:flagellar biosynthetic protein FliR [Hyphomicrobiales bacterium]